MFYAQFMLSRRGPLAKIWLAAHWEKKLTKAQILETNIGSAVDNVLDPKDKMALRTTGHLLLGIVRIYSRKTKYLLADCNEAFIKIKMAFRPGASIDLPEDNREAAYEAITLPDVARDFESALPELSSGPMDFGTQLALNQSRIDEITIKEDVPAAHTSCNWDDDFGDEGFGATEFGRDGEPSDVDMLPGASKRRRNSGGIMSGDEPMMDEFGASADDDKYDLSDEAGVNLADDDDDRMSGIVEGAATGALSPGKQDNITRKVVDAAAFDAASDITESTVLVQNDKDRFVLAPSEAHLATEKHRGRRKRRLIVDDSKAISGEDMKAQLTDHSDTVTTLDLAPPTKKLMGLKETGSVDRLLATAALELVSKSLLQVYSVNLVMRQRPDERENVDLGLALDEVRSLRNGACSPQRPCSPGAEEIGSPQQRSQFDLQLPPVGTSSDSHQQQQGPPSVSPNGRPCSSSPGALPTALEEEEPEQAGRRKADSLRAPPSPRKERRSRISQQPQEEMEDDEDDADDGETAQDEGVPRWNKRTHQILSQVRRHVQENEGEDEENEELVFADLLSGHDTRKSASQKFYSLLVLKKWRAIDVGQEEPYGDIVITAGPEINGNF